MKVEGQGLWEPPGGTECTHMCRTADCGRGSVSPAGNPVTTAPGWGWSWENRSVPAWADSGCQGDPRRAVFSQLLAAEGTSAWILGTLVPSGIVARVCPCPAGAVRAGHSCCLEDGGGALPRCLLGACSASHFPLSSLRQCGRPNRNFADPDVGGGCF